MTRAKGKDGGFNLSHVDVCPSQEADNDPTGEAAANTQQTLTFYELDLGLNHVVRKYSEALEEHGNFLITGKNVDGCSQLGEALASGSNTARLHLTDCTRNEMTDEQADND